MQDDTDPKTAGADDGTPVVVPPEMLDPATLRRVAESFVLREGTDYGEREVSFEGKVAQVLAQLADRRAELLFDPATESVTLRLRP